VGHHHSCMHTGIGAPGTHNKGFPAEQHRQCLLQFSLNGIAIGLYLPTMIVGTIV